MSYHDNQVRKYPYTLQTIMLLLEEQIIRDKEFRHQPYTIQENIINLRDSIKKIKSQMSHESARVTVTVKVSELVNEQNRSNCQLSQPSTTQGGLVSTHNGGTG